MIKRAFLTGGFVIILYLYRYIRIYCIIECVCVRAHLCMYVRVMCVLLHVFHFWGRLSHLHT